MEKRYHITGYPTVIFLRADGSEVERIIGYAPPEDFLAEMERIQAGDGTFEAVLKAAAEHPHDLAILARLGEKYDEREMYTDVLPVWQMVSAMAEAGSEMHVHAQFKLAEAYSLVEKTDEYLRTYLTTTDDEQYHPMAHQGIVSLYRDVKDTTAEAAAFRNYVDYMVTAAALSPGLANSYAWRMTQLDLNLDDALLRIGAGVDLARSADADAETLAGIMDTQAEVLWKLGRIDEAVAVMDECIQLQPDDKYFQGQRAKFIGATA